MKTFHTFKDISTFEKFLRTRYQKCTHGSGCLDYVRVGGVLYTMQEYDIDGQTITWANKKNDCMIEVNTADRYRRGYDDAKVYYFAPAPYLRDDISYAE